MDAAPWTSVRPPRLHARAVRHGSPERHARAAARRRTTRCRSRAATRPRRSVGRHEARPTAGRARGSPTPAGRRRRRRRPTWPARCRPNAHHGAGARGASRRAAACGSRCAISQRYLQDEQLQQPARRVDRTGSGHPVRLEGRRVRSVASPLRRAGQTQLDRPAGRLDAQRGRVVIQFYVLKDGTILDIRVVQPAGIEGFNDGGVQRAEDVEPGRRAAAGISRPTACSSPSRSTTTTATNADAHASRRRRRTDGEREKRARRRARARL